MRYGEKHEYVVVGGRRHYVVHPRKPTHHSIHHKHHGYHKHSMKLKDLAGKVKIRSVMDLAR